MLTSILLQDAAAQGNGMSTIIDCIDDCNILFLYDSSTKQGTQKNERLS